MFSDYDSQLPNLLRITLEHLFSEDKLVRWNINAHGDVTNITLCFAPLEFNGTWSTPHGYRRKSPSQYKRDNERFRQWSEKQNISANSEGEKIPFFKKDIANGYKAGSGQPCLASGKPVYLNSTSDLDSNLDTELTQDLLGENNKQKKPVICDDSMQLTSKTNADELIKVVHDRINDVIIGKTVSGRYVTCKPADGNSDSKEDVYQNFSGSLYMKIFNHQFHDFFQREINIIKNEKYNVSINNIRKQLESSLIT